MPRLKAFQRAGGGLGRGEPLDDHARGTLPKDPAQGALPLGREGQLAHTRLGCQSTRVQRRAPSLPRCSPPPVASQSEAESASRVRFCPDFVGWQRKMRLCL